MQEFFLTREVQAREISPTGAPFSDPATAEDRLVCTKLIRSSWPFQGDPLGVVRPSDPEYPFCKTRTLGMGVCIHACIEQKFNCVPGSELDPGDRR